MNTLTYSGTLATTSCWCGIHYAVPSEFLDAIRRQHRDGRTQTKIYCPLGHTWEFSGKGEAELLQERLDVERARSARLAADRDQIQASLSATKGQVTKLKKRVAAGVCPCCGRTFQQLSRHMANKHPDFAVGEEVDAKPRLSVTSRAKQSRSRLADFPEDDPRHGSVNGYNNLGCRCDLCKQAWADKHREYMHANPEQQRKNTERTMRRYYQQRGLA